MHQNEGCEMFRNCQAAPSRSLNRRIERPGFINGVLQGSWPGSARVAALGPRIARNVGRNPGRTWKNPG
jgi:hypothetical protein